MNSLSIFRSKLRRPEELEAEQELAVVQVKDKGNLVLNGGGTQSVGIGANALDELEKETGNDEEKNGDVTLLSSEEKGSQKKVEAASQSNLSKQEKRERKRKRKEANIERLVTELISIDFLWGFSLLFSFLFSHIFQTFAASGIAKGCVRILMNIGSIV